METITRYELAKVIAGQHGISIPRAAMTVSIVCAELELTRTALSLRTAGEIEAIAARKIKASSK